MNTEKNVAFAIFPQDNGLVKLHYTYIKYSATADTKYFKTWKILIINIRDIKMHAHIFIRNI